MYIILAYDISDNEKREKLKDYLRIYFNHVQYSVFEGYIDNKNFQKIKSNIIRYIGKTDKLIIIVLSYKKFKRIVLGKKKFETVL
ncbi:MAG: CRISPR-associated endonuclease Cas2 [Nanopusillaceae archaeon]